jgi:hypothetical protein
MGLDLVVGARAEDEDDDEGRWPAAMFEHVNRVLEAHGLRPHHEPTDVPQERCYEERVGFDGALHYLRRVAAHLEAKRGLPLPVGKGQSAKEDPVLEARHAASKASSRFAHLIEHSDAEGFYVPIDFGAVLVDASILGGYLGSSFALRRECEELAAALGLPLGLDTDAEELANGGDGTARWHAYPTEARVCLVLHRAAVTSIETGAAIVFC